MRMRAAFSFGDFLAAWQGRNRRGHGRKKSVKVADKAPGKEGPESEASG